MMRMGQESATCTYRIDAPFAIALRRLRAAVATANLNITGELDLAARIRKAILINIPPCTVLFVSPSARATERLVAASGGSGLLPLHVVIAAHGPRIEVHFLRVLPRLNEALEQPGLEAVAQVQGALARALAKIGMRSLDS